MRAAWSRAGIVRGYAAPVEPHLRLRADRVVWRLAGDEVIALELGRSEYLAVPGSGGELWQRLAEPVTAAQLATWLAERYALDAARARGDVDAFLADLVARDLVETVPAP
jgi:hypothetical protein